MPYICIKWDEDNKDRGHVEVAHTVIEVGMFLATYGEDALVLRWGQNLAGQFEDATRIAEARVEAARREAEEDARIEADHADYLRGLKYTNG